MVLTMPRTASVQCVHGANEQSVPVAGRSVCWVRQNLGDVLNVPCFAEAILNGRGVDYDHVLAAGDCLEFICRFGFKGARSSRPEVLKARGLLSVYPEISAIGEQVKAQGLGSDEAIDLTVKLVTELIGRRFGPIPYAEVDLVHRRVTSCRANWSFLKCLFPPCWR